MREEEIIREFLTLEEKAGDFSKAALIINSVRGEAWLRQTLNTYRAQVLEEERGRVSKFIDSANIKAFREINITPEVKVTKEQQCKWCMLERKEFVENLLAKNTGDVTVTVNQHPTN